MAAPSAVRTGAARPAVERRTWPTVARALACTLVLAVAWLGAASAQAGLSGEAADALRQAQALASEAVATYVRHFPDQPLWRDAIALGERAKSLAPGRPEPLRFLAQAYGLTGWTARTWEAWQEYLDAGGTLDARSRADAAHAALALGYQAYTVGALDRAAQLLRQSYALDPADVTTVTYLGETEALALGNADDALPLLRVAVATYPQLRPQLVRAELGAEHGLGAADAFIAAEQAFAQGNAAAALSLYTAALQSAPGFVDATKGAAASNGALGRTAASRALWEQVASMAPQDADAARALALFRAADTAAAEAAAAVAAAAEAQAAAEAEAAAAAAAQAQAEQTAPAVTILPPAQTPTQTPTTAVTEPAETPVQEPEATATVEQPPTQATEVTQPPAQEQPVATPPAVTAPPVVTTPPVVATPPATTVGPTLALLDTTITPRAPEAGGEGAFTFMPAPAAAVGNLDEPYDYSQGTLHLQVEVLDRPTDDPVFVQLCLVPDDLITVSPACSDASRVRLPSSGVVTATQNVTGLDGAAGVDWSQGMAQLIVVLRDTEGRPLDSRYALDTNGRPLDVTAYYPMSLRVRAALVPPGASFNGW